MKNNTFLFILFLLAMMSESLAKAQENRGASIWPAGTKTMVYKTASGKSLKLDVLYPKIETINNAPVHVFIHGRWF